MSLDRLIVLIAAAALASGCGLFHKLSGDCHSPQEYQRAGQVPPGLDSPNTQGALVIPAAGLALPAPGPKEACLDVPPRYKPAPANKAASEMPVAPPPPAAAPTVPEPSSSVPPQI